MIEETALMSSATLVGQRAPDFTLACTDLSGKIWQMRRDDCAGRWLMLIFYPRDFSFVCPTELTAFSARLDEFTRRNCQILGISVDSLKVHQDWLQTPPHAGGLGPLQFPLAFDQDGAAARSFGIWDAAKRVSMRGLFLIDPAGILQYAAVHNLNVGRSAKEVLRVLDALQTGGLCPAGWTNADGTLNLEQLLEPGRVLGHYRIRRLLGQGTFGSVFAAWDLHLERMVAVKVFFKSSPESRALLLSEARAAARLTHPNICLVYAIEELEGLPVMVMEYLDGQPLSELIGRPMSVATVSALAGPVAQALTAAHKSDLVHGDLKPANILVTTDRVPKVLDFGLARLHSTQEREVRRLWEKNAPLARADEHVQDSDATLVRRGPQDTDQTSGGEPKSGPVPGLSGTPAYMSPEQALAQPTSPASDVFSFGLILYEMLTGRRALQEAALLPLLQRLRSENFGASLASQVDGDHGELLGKMLAREPSQRPTMVDVAQFFADRD